MSTNATSQPSVVKIVEGHIEQLISEHKRLSERNRDLSDQCDKLRATKRELQERVAALEKELATSDLVTGLTISTKGDKSHARAKSYVNRLMREIDACITYMTSPEGGE